MSNESDSVPPGWYPTPQGGQRYWDGQRWLALPEPDDAIPAPAEPFVGAVTEQPNNRKKILIACVAATVVLAAAGIGAVVWKNHHDTELHNAEVAASSSKAASDKAAADAAAAAVAAENVREQRAQRASAIKDLQSSIQAMAEKHIADGLFDGPVLSVTCDPVDGGSTDDLTAKTTVFECFVATNDNGDGTLSGRKYHATMNWNTGNYTYGYGAP